MKNMFKFKTKRNNVKTPTNNTLTVNEIFKIIVDRSNELKNQSSKVKYDRQAYMECRMRWKELQRLLDTLGYERSKDKLLEEWKQYYQ